MRKSQWYIFSAVWFFLMLVFVGVKRNRVANCISTFPGTFTDALQNACVQDQNIYLVVAFIFLVLFIVFLILGMFEKSSKKR